MKRIILPSGMTIDLDAVIWTSTLKMTADETQMTVWVGGKSLILHGADAHTLTRALMTADHVDASEIEPDDFAEDLAVLLHASFEDALNNVHPSRQGVNESSLLDDTALIEAGFAQRNNKRVRNIIITQKGKNHLKSML